MYIYQASRCRMRHIAALHVFVMADRHVNLSLIDVPIRRLQMVP